jgi:hypothetical protein
LVRRDARDNPLVPTIKAAVAFLGGMNLAVALFCFYLATGPTEFASAKAQMILFAFLAAVNFSQFYFNLPILLRGQQIWSVLSGPMLMIFVIDATLTVIDAIMAFVIAVGP